MSRYHRIAHMQNQPLVKVGDWVTRGQIIGACGMTGNATGPHAHYDIMKMKPPSWTMYVYGWAKSFVLHWFEDPKPWIKDGIPMDNSFPLSGYSFLQYVKSGNYYHPGIDLNGVNDLGKPLKAPVEGRVVCVLGTTWVKNLIGKLVGKNYNSGWGNMVVIEEKPGYQIP